MPDKNDHKEFLKWIKLRSLTELVQFIQTEDEVLAAAMEYFNNAWLQYCGDVEPAFPYVKVLRHEVEVYKDFGSVATTLPVGTTVKVLGVASLYDNLRLCQGDFYLDIEELNYGY